MAQPALRDLARNTTPRAKNAMPTPTKASCPVKAITMNARPTLKKAAPAPLKFLPVSIAISMCQGCLTQRYGHHETLVKRPLQEDVGLCEADAGVCGKRAKDGARRR